MSGRRPSDAATVRAARRAASAGDAARGSARQAGSAPRMPPELSSTYRRIRPEIEARLAAFDTLWARGSEEELFSELAFCLFTPQSKAFSCWAAVERLRGCGLLLAGRADVVARELSGVRFHRNKARYLVEARATFAPGGRPAVRRVLEPLGGPLAMREWLVANVRGYGLKEASHFLRNVGQGRELAILDRHILRNLARMGVIDCVPDSLPRQRYIAFEGEMAAFAETAGIPLAHLDFLLWHKEAGAVFK